MSEKHAYNYRQIMSEPVEVQKLTDKFSLPKPIKVTAIGVFILTDIIMYFTINDLIISLNNMVPGILAVIYIGAPYLINKIFENLRLDGLRLDQYLLSRFNFFRKISFSKKIVYQDKYLETTDEPVIFSKIHRLEVREE